MTQVFQDSKDVTIGAGRLFIADVNSDGTPGPFSYVGDSDGFNITTTTTRVEKYAGDGPVAEKIVDQTVQIDHQFGMTLNEVRPENMAIALLGETAVRQQEADATFEEVTTAKLGSYVNLGATAENPAGVKNISGVEVTDGDTTTYDIGDDYEVDLASGVVYIRTDGAISEDDPITISATVPEEGFVHTFTASDGIGKKALRYMEDAAEGINRDIYIPYCDVRPEGTIELKSRDEIQQITLELTALVPRTGGRAVTIEDRDPS